MWGDCLKKIVWYERFKRAIIDRLRDFDGIHFEDVDVISVIGKAGYYKTYKGKEYNVNDPVQAIRLYQAITGKPQTIFTAKEYAEYLKERKGKHE